MIPKVIRPSSWNLIVSIFVGILAACSTSEPIREVESATVTFEVGASRAQEYVEVLNDLLEASREAARRRGCALYPPERLPIREARGTWFEARGDDVVVMRMDAADEAEVDAACIHGLSASFRGGSRNPPSCAACGIDQPK